jgi:hypothetical protein
MLVFNCKTTFSKSLLSILKIQRPWYNVFDFNLVFLNEYFLEFWKGLGWGNSKKKFWNLYKKQTLLICTGLNNSTYHPIIPRLNTLGLWHSHTFSLSRVNHRDMCIYSNTPHPSPGVDHKGSRHVVTRQMLQLHPTPILMVIHRCDKSCYLK